MSKKHSIHLELRERWLSKSRKDVVEIQKKLVVCELKIMMYQKELVSRQKREILLELKHNFSMKLKTEMLSELKLLFKISKRISPVRKNEASNCYHPVINTMDAGSCDRGPLARPESLPP